MSDFLSAPSGDSGIEHFFELSNRRWQVPFKPVWVMGIVNVTPDSFSDGGLYLDGNRAVERALQQVEYGARIIDVGAESTRPGSIGVDPSEQIRRALPVVRGLRKSNSTTPISIDTCSSAVARAALQAGANMVNDTSALRDDSGLADVIAEFGASVVLMHRKGTPRDMQSGGGPVYQDIVGEIADFLTERVEFAVRRGIQKERIAIDPGIGFGKRSADNLKIIKEIGRLTSLGRPVVIGASRKKFIGDLLQIDEPKARTIGSVACAIMAALEGASILRVHDVAETVQAVAMMEAIRES